MHSVHYGDTTFRLIGKGHIEILESKDAVQDIRDHMRRHCRESTGWETWDETWSEPEFFQMIPVGALNHEETTYIPCPVNREDAEYFEIRFVARKKV